MTLYDAKTFESTKYNLLWKHALNKHEEMGDIVDKDKDETSNTLLMFGHFVLPPSHHENMPSGPENA